MDVLALGELDVAHARVAQRQGEAVKPASAPVAEVAPVHLALFTRAGLEAHEGSFAPFLPPRGDRQFQRRVAAVISATANLVQRFVGYALCTPFSHRSRRKGRYGSILQGAGFSRLYGCGASSRCLRTVLRSRLSSSAMADTLHPCCFKSRMFIKSSRLSIGLLGQPNDSTPGDFSTGATGEFSIGAFGEF